MVRAYIATLRAAPPQAPPPPPTVRQVTDWLTRHPTALSEEERAALKDVLARCPELDTAAGHIRDFGEILTHRLGPTLPAWINAVDASQLPGLTNFAVHMLRDLDAVTAGLTLHWSSGGTERRREPHQKDQKAALRTSRIRTTPQDGPPSVTLRDRTPRSVPEPSIHGQSQPKTASGSSSIARARMALRIPQRLKSSTEESLEGPRSRRDRRTAAATSSGRSVSRIARSGR